MKHIKFFYFVFTLLLLSSFNAQAKQPYTLLPGDQINISVWNEAALNLDLIVLPDGSITFPLAGRLIVENLSTTEISNLIKQKLQSKEIITDPEVSVTVTAVTGNQVYVIGKVAQPGVYTLNRNLTVPQLLSLAGGLDRFADENEIKILTGQEENAKFIKFDYNQLLDGTNSQAVNIKLKAGDVVIVP